MSIATPSAFAVRDYQETCVRGIFDAFDQENRTLVVMPTGTGKTVVFWQAIREHLRRSNQRVLVIAHREELINQAAAKGRSFGIDCDIEMAQSRADGGLIADSPVVVASVQSLNAGRRCQPCQSALSGALADWEYEGNRRQDFPGYELGCNNCLEGIVRRIQRFQPAAFGLIVVDEAHHSTAASYQRVLDYFDSPTTKVLGVTATPDRHDEESLGQIYRSVAFEYELPDAIRDGWLVPIEQQFVEVEDLDLSNCRKNKEGDMQDKDVAAAMATLRDEGSLHKMVDPTVQLAGDRRTLVFAASVAHAEAMADIFNRHQQGSAEWLCGTTPKESRRETLQRFARGKFQYLCNCALFLEGFDDPGIECVAVGRPTASRALYCLDEQTEILTEAGWAGIGDADNLGRLAAFNMQTGEITWEECEAVVKREQLEGETFVSCSLPATRFRVTANHDMVVRSRQGRSRTRTEWRKIYAEQMLALPDCFEVPIAGRQSAPGVPLTDDELRFIGWVMTDGTINRINKQITISQRPDNTFFRDLVGVLDACRFKYTRHDRERTTNYSPNPRPIASFTVSHGKPRGTGKHLRGWGELEPWLSKEFAERLEDLTREQLLTLLDAMNMGDGCKQSGQSWEQRSYHIASFNRKCLDRIQSICVRRGIKCNVSPINGKGWMLHIKDTDVKSLRNGASDSRPSPSAEPQSRRREKVWCAQNRMGTLVTRHQGSVTIVGNCQIVGRGTRPLPGVTDNLADTAARRSAIATSQKPSVLVLDYVGNSGRHKLISTADILGGQESDRVVQLAYELARHNEGAEPVDMAQAIEKAKEALKRREDEEERLRQERAKRSHKRIVKTTFSTKAVNPFDVFDISPKREPGWHKGRKPTEKQKAALAKFGVDDGAIAKASFSQASQMLDTLFKRIDAGKCSLKQARILKRQGFSADCSFAEASATIDRIVKSGWKLKGNA